MKESEGQTEYREKSEEKRKKDKQRIITIHKHQGLLCGKHCANCFTSRMYSIFTWITLFLLENCLYLVTKWSVPVSLICDREKKIF